MGFGNLWDVVGAGNGGIDWRDGQKTGSQMAGQMILMTGWWWRRRIGLVGRGDTGGGICIPPGSPLRVNDLGGELGGFRGGMLRRIC